MITGTLRRIDGKWYVDHSYSMHDEPTLCTVRWPVTDFARRGSYGPAPEPVDGLEMTHESGHGAQWQAYKHGGYLIAVTPDQGEAIKTPIPCPKVRAGIETRYAYGKWEKALKSGWVPA